jgi:membrane protease YdiL (CAAX protease family)
VNDDLRRQQVAPGEPSEIAGQPAVPWSFLDAAGIFVVFIVLLALVSPAISTVLGAEMARGALFPVSFAVLAAITLLWVRVRYPGRVGDLLGGRPTAADLGMGMVHGLAAFFVINMGIGFLLQTIARFTGADMPEVQQGLREAATDGLIGPVVIVSAVLVAPIAEELFFRGLLFRGLRGPLGAWPAIGISAFVFGLAHYEASNVEGSLYALIVLATFGMHLAWVLDRRRSIAVPIVMHATFNALAVVGIFLTT